MKAILLALLLVSCSAKQSGPDGDSSLSSAEVTEALRDALGRSIARGAAYASITDGYYGDPRLRIELPHIP